MQTIFRIIKKPANLILCSIFILVMLSLLILTSINSAKMPVSYREVVSQTAAFILGMIALIVIYTIGYNYLHDLDRPMYIASIALLLTVYIPVLGLVINGSRAWINLGVTTVQPSEFVKPIFILLTAKKLSKFNKTDLNLRDLGITLLYTMPIIIIVAKEDFGSSLVFLSILAVMLIFAGLDKRIIIAMTACIILLVPISYNVMKGHQKDRIDAFLHPDNLALPGNHHVFQSKIAIGSGGFLGKGLFAGTQKELGYLPVQSSDFIYSVICEELGLLGGLLVLVMIGVLLYNIVKICLDANSLYAKLICAGVFAMIAFQTIENIAMTMGVMPVAGITLPFVSYGGSSIISMLISIGLVLSVNKSSYKTQI